MGDPEYLAVPSRAADSAEDPPAKRNDVSPKKLPIPRACFYEPSQAPIKIRYLSAGARTHARARTQKATASGADGYIIVNWQSMSKHRRGISTYQKVAGVLLASSEHKRGAIALSPAPPLASHLGAVTWPGAAEVTSLSHWRAKQRRFESRIAPSRFFQCVPAHYPHAGMRGRSNGFTGTNLLASVIADECKLRACSRFYFGGENLLAICQERECSK